MRDRIRTSVGQFSIADKRLQPRAANVRAVEPAPDLVNPQRGSLYLMVEVSGSGGGHAALYRQILGVAQSAFYDPDGTITIALKRAVQAAHNTLQRANDALPEARWRAGISCCAILGADVIIAQSGPGLVLVSHAKTIDQFPPEVNPGLLPLGDENDPEVQYARTQVEPGSVILIAESNWARLVSPQVLAYATTGEDVPQVMDYLTQLAGDHELTALVVGIGGWETTPVVASQGTNPPRFTAPRPEERHESHVEAPAVQPPTTRPVVTPPASRPAGTPPVTQPVKRPPVTPPTTRPAATPPVTPPTTRPAVTRPAVTRAPEPQLPPATSDWTAVDEPETEPWDDESPTVAQQRRRRTPADTGGRRQRSRLPLVLALLIVPLLIAVVVLGMMWMRGRQAEVSFAEALAAAEGHVASAQALPDEGSARSRLTEARAQLTKASGFKPDDPRLAPVTARYDELLNKVNHVTPLYGGVPMWDFTEAGTELARVIVSGNSLYVLDRGRDEVSHFVLSELRDTVTASQPRVIVHKNQQLTDGVVGDLVDMTWVEAVSNQRSRLLAIDSARGLVAFETTWGAQRVPLAGRDQLQLPYLVASYSGNLYVVDTQRNGIWRFRPSDKGYDNTPDPYFTKDTQVDLGGVQSISIDGNIWLLYANGTVLKFYAGEQKPFAFSGLPDPLNNPTAIVASAEANRLYVADAGNGRIVEFDKEGKFLRQLRPAQGDMLKGVRSLFLDESNSAIYLLSGTRLYKANLAKPATPAAAPAPASAPAATSAPASVAATATPTGSPR